MKRKFLYSTICALVLLVQLDAGAQQKRAVAVPVVSSAKSVLTMLSKENYTGVSKSFDSDMRNALPPAKLREVWQALTKQLGSFKRLAGAQSGRAEDSGATFDVVTVTCEFERAPVNARLVFNRNRQVSGLYFVPVSKR